MLERFARGMLHLGLAESGASLVEASGLWRARARPACSTAPSVLADFDALLARADALLGERAPRRGSAVRVVLADAWLRLWMVTPPRNALRRLDCEAAAAARFEALYGEPLGEAYRLSAHWQARGPFLAAALPTARLQALLALLERHGLQVDAIEPQLVAAWNRWRSRVPASAWFGLLAEGRLNLVARAGDSWLELRTLGVDPPALADAGWLQAALRREAARLCVEAPACVALSGPVPPAWSAAQREDWRCIALDAELDAPSAAERLALLGLA